MSDYFRQNSSNLAFSNAGSWVILSPIEQKIKEKIEKIGTPLKDWDIKINYGIKTGFNDAFIIDGAKRKELIDKDPKSEEIIRPLLRGRDIKKYSYDYADLYIIFIPWHFPLHNNPNIKGASIEAEEAFENQYNAVYKHLLQYKKELSNRNKAETGIRYEWYALQRWGANYWEDFYRPKIIWIELTNNPNFCLDNNNYLINNTIFFINGERLEYLVSYLNSNVCKWHFTKLAATSGVGTTRWIKIYIEQLRVPMNLDPLVEKELTNLSAEIQIQKSKNINTDQLETEVNQKIYSLFSLNEDEIGFIESQ